MKTHIKTAAIAIMLCLTGQLFAQRPKEIKNSEVEGLYLSLSDFHNGKLTHPTDMLHVGDKIKLKQFFISPDIISIEQNKETVFYKDSIFAIRLTNGENYRFINRTPCLVADTSYLYIYTNKTTKTEYKQSGRRRVSKVVPITYYYFSTGNHKAVFTLTLANLRKYALSDTLVHKTICDKYTTDEMLYKVNPQTGKFELNETILLIQK
ncbi:MAG: hypothetical protein A2W99_15995 [Bacteroidetes bacterium GWF2_33_16]|nr:MAG: hypothetical protein A2X00_15340 [Bacteroidetes bacterium GWE2_32_14]OFY02403.1 MAG: hypothetical protein A2W99_15995 [Bacteroidetes bacterium GWF2_33_16]